MFSLLSHKHFRLALCNKNVLIAYPGRLAKALSSVRNMQKKEIKKQIDLVFHNTAYAVQCPLQIQDADTRLTVAVRIALQGIACEFCHSAYH